MNIIFGTDEENECIVSVILDGEESAMEFVDLKSCEEEDAIRGGRYADIYVVVYSLMDRKSFEKAIDRLYVLRKVMKSDRSIILVGNKSDLVRVRIVAEDGEY